MKAVRLNKIGDFRMEEVPLPEVKGEELLVKVEACGICGSDLPRVFELGAHVHPITIGHEFAGPIVKAAREEDQERVGKTAAVFPLIPCVNFVKPGTTPSVRIITTWGPGVTAVLRSTVSSLPVGIWYFQKIRK